MTFTQYAPVQDRLRRSFISKMGGGSRHLRITEIKPGQHGVYDDADGSWAIYDTTGWRIRMLSHHDAVAAALGDAPA